MKKATGNSLRLVGIIALVAVIGFTVVACGKGGGGNDPKSLAKQTYQVFAKAMEAQGQKPGNITFVMWMSKEPQELAKVMEKVEALSKDGQQAYEDELEKLLDEAEKKSGGK